MANADENLVPRRRSARAKRVSYALHDPAIEETLGGIGDEVVDTVEEEFSPAPEELEDADLEDEELEEEEFDDGLDDSPGPFEDDSPGRQAVINVKPTKGKNKATSAKGARETFKRAQKAKAQEIGLSVAFIRAPGTQVHSRGLVEKPHHARGSEEGVGVRIGQKKRIESLFGPNHEDIKPVFQSRDKWEDQEPLPRRSEGDLRVSYYVNSEAIEKEFERVKQSKILECLAKGQKFVLIHREQAERYTRTRGPETLPVLMGPVYNPQLLSIKKGAWVNINEPFQDDKSRRGWICNLGAHIQETQWAPNEEGHTQFLAVAVQQSDLDGYQHPPLSSPRAPAFTATREFSASIQIWAFQSTDEGNLEREIPPQLKLVLCTDWGAPKQFRWCPFPVADARRTEEDNTVHIGLLAGIWSDGRVRIIDVSYRENDGAIQYIKYTKAAFEVFFSDTIATSLHWLSASSLAVATTFGTLAIWNLLHKSAFPTSDSKSQSYNPRPWFYRSVIDNYILNITSGYPSRPNYVSVTSTDGFSRMIDLRSTLDVGVGNKGRNFATTQAWHEHTQSFLLPDEMYLLRNASVRRYYSNVYSGRMDSTITKVATSLAHPGILVGSADGLVVVGNPIMRVLNSKELVWQLPWFAHEWRRPVKELVIKPEDPNEDIDMEGTQASVTQKTTASVAQVKSTHDQPLSCFRESLIPRQINLHIKAGRTPDFDFSAKRLTAFEEPSGITALAWNPNIKFGTWAVAGMGDGLMRVEDLGIDEPAEREGDIDMEEAQEPKENGKTV